MELTKVLLVRAPPHRTELNYSLPQSLPPCPAPRKARRGLLIVLKTDRCTLDYMDIGHSVRCPQDSAIQLKPSKAHSHGAGLRLGTDVAAPCAGGHEAHQSLHLPEVPPQQAELLPGAHRTRGPTRSDLSAQTVLSASRDGRSACTCSYKSPVGSRRGIFSWKHRSCWSLIVIDHFIY